MQSYIRHLKWARVGPADMESAHVVPIISSNRYTAIWLRSKLLTQEATMNPTLVSRNSEIMSGALCFTGTRVLVQSLFDYLEGSSSLEDFLKDFPSIERENAVAVLESAKERLYTDAPVA